MQLNATQLEFLVRLGKSPEGQQLQSLLKAEVDEVNEKLRVLSGEALTRAQGRAQCLDDLLDRLAPRLKPMRDVPKRPFQSLPGALA